MEWEGRKRGKRVRGEKKERKRKPTAKQMDWALQEKPNLVHNIMN